MNKKGFELAVSTIIIFVLGVLVLLGLIFLVRNGFSGLKKTTEPFLDTAGANAVKEACSIACKAENTLTYCCNDFEISGEKIRCSDERLDNECSLSCAATSCLND